MISVNLGGVVVVFVNDGTRRKQAAVLDVEVVADAKLNLQVCSENMARRGPAIQA